MGHLKKLMQEKFGIARHPFSRSKSVTRTEVGISNSSTTKRDKIQPTWSRVTNVHVQTV